MLLVLISVGCGSRAGVDLLGGPMGRGGQSLLDAAGPHDSGEPTDAPLAPDGIATFDAADERIEIDVADDRGEPAPDRAAFDSGRDVNSTDGPGPDSPRRDAGICDGGLLCGNTCVDPMTDNDNCGSCNLKCNIFTANGVTMGGCKNGACAPAYASCFVNMKAYFTCDEICAQEGQTCVQGGCMGATHIEYEYSSDCDSKVVSMIYTNELCNQHAQFASGQRAGRCCCAKRKNE
jgi:hypothetical protein